jgi:hypothetical protein
MSRSSGVSVCQEPLDDVKKDRNFLRVITGDETRVYCYDPETKHQFFQWKKPFLPMPEESEASQVQHQEHIGDLFLL